MANDGDEWQLGAVTDPAHDVVSDEPGRCVNANDVEQGDVDDGGEMYYRHRKVYIGKPLHKHNAPARRAQRTQPTRVGSCLVPRPQSKVIPARKCFKASPLCAAKCPNRGLHPGAQIPPRLRAMRRKMPEPLPPCFNASTRASIRCPSASMPVFLASRNASTVAPILF